jgi:hypothetical protein
MFSLKQEGREGPACGIGVERGSSGRVEEVGKGWRRVNMVQYRVCMYVNAKVLSVKVISVETIPGNAGRKG